MPDKNEVTWTAMLKGYTKSGRINEAAELFKAMPDKPVAACNEMIMGFGLNGEVGKARWVFDQMKEKDDGTWSALIKIYERKGFELEALALFRLMQSEGDQTKLPIHHKYSFRKRVFDRFSSKDIVMWNSIIAGYAQHGSGEKALEVFHEMLSSGAAPDEITFIGVLSACGYTGKVKEGLEIFESMKSKYQVDKKTEHYACMVDLLGRAGKLNEAMNMIENMPVEADAIATDFDALAHLLDVCAYFLIFAAVHKELSSNKRNRYF
ncbi:PENTATRICOPEPTIDE REPEAT-CONTAINING PROTEIN [Salix purpurea]|uniref:PENTATRICOPEPTIDE REPEAT-CONTAINING PROTEIN n=1 Tax=Salix purpurea TaxID=77065 RepID=A0A9Q0W9K1_SALPP|nr:PENTATRICOPEPTIDE REPEAT-CONTAINING PROTEIN [Salix purpurea]